MTLFAIVAFAGAIGFLVLGISSMAQGGEFDHAHATQYMAGRVAMQGLALLMLLFGMLATIE